MRTTYSIWLVILAALLLVGCAAEGGVVDSGGFRGVIHSGAVLSESKGYCAEGLFLVGDEDFPNTQKNILLLRQTAADGSAALLTDAGYSGKSVRVSGTYPAQDFFCEALLCECEDYILVEKITIE